MKIDYKPNPYVHPDVAVISADANEYPHTIKYMVDGILNAGLMFAQDPKLSLQLKKPGTKVEITVRVVQTAGPDWNEIPEGYNVFTVDYAGCGQAWPEAPDHLVGSFISVEFDFKHIGQFPLSMYGIQYRPGYEPEQQ